MNLHPPKLEKAFRTAGQRSWRRRTGRTEVVFRGKLVRLPRSDAEMVRFRFPRKGQDL